MAQITRDHILTFSATSFRTLAYALLGIFQTLYIFQIFTNDASLVDYAVFLVLVRASIIWILRPLLLIPITSLLTKIGTKWMLVIGVFLTVLQLAGLILVDTNLWWFTLEISANVLLMCFLAVPFQLSFTEMFRRREFGSSLGILGIVTSLVAIAAPTISGFLIDSQENFTLLFAIVASIHFMGAVSYSLMRSNLKLHSIHTSNLKRYVSTKRNLIPGYILIGFDNVVTSYIWPIMIFAFISDFSELGIILSAVSIMLAVYGFVIGKLSDKGIMKNLGDFPYFLHSAFWVVKIFMNNGIQVFATDSVTKSTETTIGTPLDVNIYDDAKISHSVWPFVVKELSLDIGRAIFSITAAILVFFNVELWVILAILAILYSIKPFLFSGERAVIKEITPKGGWQTQYLQHTHSHPDGTKHTIEPEGIEQGGTTVDIPKIPTGI